MDRPIPAGVVEQWIFHLRRQRSRALDAIWLIEQGFTIHDGKDGVPRSDATQRWLTEQRTVVAEVDVLLAAYSGLNIADDEMIDAAISDQLHVLGT